MKLETSINNAMKVAQRIKKCNGLVGTPEASHEALRIKRAWVFGSTVKGKLTPSDTDILIECVNAGRFNLANAKLEPKRYSCRLKLNSTEAGLKHLRIGLKMIRFHHLSIDGNLGDINKTKVMIYPRNDLPKLSTER